MFGMGEVRKLEKKAKIKKKEWKVEKGTKLNYVYDDYTMKMIK